MAKSREVRAEGRVDAWIAGQQGVAPREELCFGVAEDLAHAVDRLLQIEVVTHA